MKMDFVENSLPPNREDGETRCYRPRPLSILLILLIIDLAIAVVQLFREEIKILPPQQYFLGSTSDLFISPECGTINFPAIMSAADIQEQPYPALRRRVYQPHMEPPEMNFFKRTVRLANYSVYYEFGSGGSTGFASRQQNLKSVTTVDTDVRFIASIRDYILEKDKLFAYWVNIGRTKEWGVPVPEELHLNPCSGTWPRFALSYHALRQPNTDLVFIDGRFRVACVFAVLLSGDRPDFLIHDYGSEDRNYYAVELVLNRVRCVSSLCLFKPKPDIKMDVVVDNFIKYMSAWES